MTLDEILSASKNGRTVVEVPSGRHVHRLYRGEEVPGTTAKYLYGLVAGDLQYFWRSFDAGEIEVLSEVKDVGAAHYVIDDGPPKALTYEDLKAALERGEVVTHGPSGDRVRSVGSVAQPDSDDVEGTPPPFRKADAGKSLVGAVPPRALLAVGRVLAHGATKYGRDNWRKVDDVRRYHDAALRHVLQYLSGERVDAESGESHLAHAVCSLMFVLDIDEGGGK